VTARVLARSLVIAAALSSLLVATGIPARAQLPGADLSLSVVAPTSVAVGDSFDYTFTVANESGDTTDAQVIITLPVNVTVNTVASECTAQGPVVTCTLSAVSPDDPPLDLVFNVTAGTPGAAVASGTVLPTSTIDLNLTNNVAVALTTIGIGTPVTGDVTIEKTADPSPGVVGEDLTYTLTVTNAEGSNPTTALVTDLMLGDVTLVSAVSDGPDDTCTAGADQFVSCDMATIAVGGTRTVTIVVQPNQPLPITNTATVLPTAILDLNVTNNVAVLITEVEAAPTPSPSPSPTETQSESPSPVPSGTTPVGGIQTGAGGTAGGSTVPTVLIVLAVTASGLFVLRRRARLRG
jgi:uncharacterized repeat protein (TIGR01451 family)